MPSPRWSVGTRKWWREGSTRWARGEAARPSPLRLRSGQALPIPWARVASRCRHGRAKVLLSRIVPPIRLGAWAPPSRATPGASTWKCRGRPPRLPTSGRGVPARARAGTMARPYAESRAALRTRAEPFGAHPRGHARSSVHRRSAKGSRLTHDAIHDI